MKKIIVPLLVSFFIWNADLFGQDQADAPEYKNGDSWVFRNAIGGRNPVKASNQAIGDYELTYSNGKWAAQKIEGDQKSPTTDSMTVLRGMFASESSKLYLQFPLTVGKKWDFEYQTTAIGKAIPMRSQVEVTKIEEIETPAGKFRVFKIERTDVGGAKIKWDRIYYYSPQTRSVVKYRFETLLGHVEEIELVKFGSAR